VTLLGQPFTQHSSLRAEVEPSGSSIADSAVDEETLAKDASTEINVKNADLTAIVRIFSKKTRRNFILDERVKGKVSIYLPGKVSAEESLRILDSVLAYKGFASVPIGPNLWKIVPAKEARTSTIPTRTTRPDGTPGPEIVTRLVQLKFIGADDVRAILQQLISSDGFISAYSSTNSLILIDSEDNIERLVDIMSTLDVPFSNREMTIIPIVHAEAKDIADKLSEILGIGSSGNSGASQESSPLDFGLEIARARVRQIAMQSAAAQGNQGGVPTGTAAISEQPPSTTGTRAIQPKIIPDERTNSIIVVADDDTTARVQALVSQLDSKIDLSGAQFWIYRCQHAKAEDLAEVLSSLTGSGGSRSGTGSGGGLFDTSQDLISGGTRSANRNRTQSRLQSQSRTPGQPRQAAGGDRGVASADLGEDISITADPATNTLILRASKADYEKIKRLLLDIDIKRRQVLVEAMLLEVGIDDSRTTDVSWLTSGGGADGGVIAPPGYKTLQWRPRALGRSPLGVVTHRLRSLRNRSCLTRFARTRM
jgi:general secretion pathway protein D